MADETTGKLSKKQWYILAAGGALYVGYRWYESRNTSSTGTATAAGTATTPGTLVGTDANGNPVYLNSSGQTVDANGNPDTVATGTASSLGESYVNPNPIDETATATANEPSTDTAWTAAVEQDLENIGYDPQTVATAIAQYLASQPLTPAQVTIIRTAWAYEGRPPGEPNLPIIQTNGPGTTTGGGTGVTALPTGTILNVPVLLTPTKTAASVAKQAGISVQHLQTANPTSQLASGDVIQVPVQVKPTGWSATWQSIASYWGISVAHLQANNPGISGVPATS